MRTTIMSQRAERDKLMAQPYLMRQTSFMEKEMLQSPLIKLITGPRRAGKSVYALLMLRNENCAYLNFDDINLLEKWDEDLVMGTLKEVYPNYKYLLLDEVQNLPNWDMWVSKLYRNGINMVITGSNAKMLSSEMATVLTGRYIQIQILPFSLSETFSYYGLDVHAVAVENQAQAKVIVDDYLYNGGFPETLLSRSLTKNYLNTLYYSVVWKDIVQRHRVRNSNALQNVAGFLLSNFCNPFTINAMTEELGLKSVATSQKFCNYLSEPYLFFYLPRYNNKLKLMKKAPQKVYVVDNGFVLSSSFNVSENLGRLLENQVFVELLRRGYDVEKNLFYYRSRNDKEVDFVIRQGTKVMQLIQVCYNMSSPKIIKREIDSLIECAGELQCKNLMVVTLDEETTIEQDGYTIQVTSITKF